MRYAPYDKAALAKALRQLVERERHFRNPSFTSAMAAEALGIARSTLIKVMHDEMGITFADYLDLCRVRYARRMLKRGNGQLSMEQLTLLSGFGSRVSFYRKYKAHYGELPTDTQKQDRRTNKYVTH